MHILSTGGRQTNVCGHKLRNVVSLGERWKAAREAAGLSVIEASRAAGVHRNTIYGMEKGDDGITLRIMQKLADVYGVTFGEVFRDESAPVRLPVEFQPLLEPLRPLNQEQRESIIRNVAASLSFMGRMYGAVTPSETERPPQPSVSRGDQPGVAVRI